MQPALKLIEHLSRGGFGYYWIKFHDGVKKTIWFDSQHIDFPSEDGDIYMGVNPSKIKKDSTKRAELEDIAAINTIYAEFDAKDFGTKDKLPEHFEQNKLAAYLHVKELPIEPSVVIDSGGGYHCYWLLDDTHPIKSKREFEEFAYLQAAWVELVKGDPTVKDLARVLRVPGTYNYKYDPPKEVMILQDSGELYYLEDFKSLIPKQPLPEENVKLARTDLAPNLDKWLNEAIQRGCEGRRNETGFWLACQMRDDGIAMGEAETVVHMYQSAVQHGQGGAYTTREADASLKSAYESPRREPAARKNGNGHPPLDVRQAIEPPAPPPEDPPPPEDTTPTRPTVKAAVAGQQVSEIDSKLPELIYLDLSRIRECLNMAQVGDADLFTDLFRDHVVYDHSDKHWYVWRGHYWERDRTGYVYQLISRRIGPQYLFAASQVTGDGNKKLADDLLQRAGRLRSKTYMDQVLDLANKNFGMGLTGEEWDLNPWVLACTNGVLDLHSGDLHPGKPRDYIRSKVPTKWVSLFETCPTFETFIGQVFANNVKVTEFIQRMLGYSITGLTVNHIFPILYGEGGNGKGTLLEVLQDVLGPDITQPTDSESLMETGRGGGPQPTLYKMRGKRLVWASESKEGRRIDEGLIKRLTGGDRLSVRTLYTEEIEFDPTHTIMLLTNHKPHINADGRAIWRRVLLIPFEQYFVENPSKDNEHPVDIFLKEKLVAEASGILAWLVMGCLAWQELGLAAPDDIIAATNEYRQEEDTIAMFISNCCITRKEVSVKSGLLYEAYTKWCKDSGLSEMSLTTWGKKMKTRFESSKSNGVWYHGIGLLEEQK